MYAICGMLETTLIEFNKLPLRDVQAWTTLISGYTRHERGIEALQTFKLMKQQKIEPNEVTLISVLKACSSISALEHGRQAHSQLIELGFAVDAVTGNALVDMYAKCGNLEDAHRVLQGSANHDIVGWSSLMQGYALQCNYQQAFQCYEHLLRSGLKPDYVTFICLISACAHPGLLDEGCSFFNSMVEQYGITPLVEHYNALVDLLGQVGKLAEAEDLLDTLSSPSNVVGWTSLLCSCKKHGNVTLGKRCFDLLIKLEPEDAAGYTALMSSIYIQAGLYEDAKRLKETGKKARKWKKPAKSCIEVGTQVHSFTVGDKAHPQHEQIHARLAGLMKKIGKLGYQPLPLDSKENQDLLCGHSEKLAVAFGLLSTPEGSTIRVTKNLRMCSDCHTAIRIASKAELRKIVVIDTFCIHRFDDGDCCCNET
jgi:pentatricopeptide repeat protein